MVPAYAGKKGYLEKKNYLVALLGGAEDAGYVRLLVPLETGFRDYYQVDALAGSRAVTRAEMLRRIVQRVLAAYVDAQPIGLARLAPRDLTRFTPTAKR